MNGFVCTPYLHQDTSNTNVSASAGTSSTTVRTSYVPHADVSVLSAKPTFEQGRLADANRPLVCNQLQRWTRPAQHPICNQLQTTRTLILPEGTA